MVAYTPVELTKGGKTTVTQNIEEEVELRYDGWLPTGSPTPDDTWDVVRHGDLRNPSSKPYKDLRAAFVTVAKDMVGDDATDNRAYLQGLADQGGIVILPRTSGRYAIAGTITLNVPGTQIYAWGAPLRQATDVMALFQAVAPDCLIDGVYGYGSATVDLHTANTAWQNTIIASRWAVVDIYASAHRLKIPWIRGEGMSSVVRFSGWDAATDAAATYRVKDVEIGTVLSDRVEFGLVASSTQRLRVGSVRGTYGNIVYSPRGTHLVYLSEGGIGHLQPQIGDCSAQDGQGSCAYQLKGITGGQAGRLLADNCPGVLNVMNDVDFDITDVISTNDTYADSAAASLTVDQSTGTTQRVHIENVKIQLLGDARSVVIFNGTEVEIEDLKVQVNHATTGAATQYDVDIRGSNNIIRRATVNNIGPKAWTAVGAFSGSGHRVEGLKATNVRYAFDTRATNLVVDYDRDLITLHPTDGMAIVSVLNTSAPGCKINSRQSLPLRSAFGLLAADSFEAAFGSGKALAVPNTGQLYEKPTGTWLIDGTTMRTYESAGAANALALLNVAQADVAIEVGLKYATASGLAARVVDSANFLTLNLHSSGNLRLRKVVAGTSTVLVDTPFAVTTGRRYRMRMVVIGASVQGYIDDALIVSYTLTGGDEVTYGTATKHGLFSSAASAARFDSLRILAA